MKKILISSLSLLAISAIFLPSLEVKANTHTEEVDESVSTPTNREMDMSNYQTTAFDLVISAYRGEYKAQGISPYTQLVTDYMSGEITAQDIVMAAIISGDLEPQAMEDEEYLNAVDLQVQSLEMR